MPVPLPGQREVDLSRIRDAHDIHVALAAGLGLPDGYRHDWDAFHELISSGHLLPDELTIRGLDHAERILPLEVHRMLACLGEYNNSSDHPCSVSVSDDYDTSMFFLTLEVRPTPGHHDDIRGAYVNCWIKAASAEDALRIAQSTIETEHWQVISQDEPAGFSPRDPADEDEPFIRQACVDGAVFAFHTWSSDD